MNKQYALICENQNDYFEVTEWIKQTGIINIDIEFICNPPADINKFEGVIAVFSGSPHNEWGAINSWVGHSHLRCVCGNNMQAKKQEFYKAFCHMLGIPAPVEIERKYLIKLPDIEYLNSLPNCRGIEISQSYLDIPNANVRIRKRNGIYIKTEKSKLTELTRQETESMISEQEYNKLMEFKHPQLDTVTKARYCLLWSGKYFEIDVFPFWNDVAYLEIELMSEDEKVELPPFVQVIKEVTFDKRYTNKSLAGYLKQGNIKELFA